VISQDASTIHIGTAAENMAEKALRDAGLLILERNYRCKMGEIDIIAKEPSLNKSAEKLVTLVFIEVRQRSHRSFGSGLDSVDHRKQKKIIRTAKHFLQERHFFDQYPCRFDIVSFRSPTDMQWIKDAFQSY
jgi:putative endonuclease